MKKIATVIALALATQLGTGCTAIIAGTAIGTTAVVASDSRSAGTMVDDKTIELKSLNIIKNNAKIYKESKLEATSVNGTVVVTGQCTNEEYIKFVVDNIKQVPQVTKVVNRVAVMEPVGVGQRSQDSWITTKVKTQLLFGREINSGRFKVITENAEVFLIGLVTKSEASRAVNVVKDIDGVRKVVKVFEYIDDSSKVTPIFEDKNANTTIVEDTVVEKQSAAIEDVKDGNLGNSDTPIYYEETTIIEQPNQVVEESTELSIQDNSFEDKSRATVSTVTQPQVERLNSNDEMITDDSFIIE